ncbi:hypothetical protein GCK32_015284, partial [Trichostrongylus colubriformis]
ILDSYLTLLQQIRKRCRFRSDRVNLIKSDEKVTPTGTSRLSSEGAKSGSADRERDMKPRGPSKKAPLSIPRGSGEKVARIQQIPVDSTGLKRPSKTDTRDSQGTIPSSKRKRISPSLFTETPAATSKPSSLSFFPYWTGQRHMFSKVGP